MESEFEEYYTQCGEMYLTIKGNISFHCILCENICKSFEEYANHTKIHYQEYVDEEALIDIEPNPNTESENEFQIHNEADDAESSMFSTTDALESTISVDLSNVKNEVVSGKTTDDSISKNQKIIKKLRAKPIKHTDKPRKYKCTHCSYACTDSSNLKAHIKRHSAEKSAVCEICSKAFHTRRELNIHLRIHTGEKPYLCSVCGRSFITTTRLCMHQKRHFNNRDKKCKLCDYACYDTTTLRRHIATHSEERSYKCPQCEASFKAKVALWNHIKIHENKKEYACKLCDSKFNQLAGLYSHMKSSHTFLV